MKNQNLIPALLLTALLFGCKKEETPAPVSTFCWACEITTEKAPTNGMAGTPVKTSANYCGKTAADIAGIEKAGTGVKEVAEFGQVVRYNVSTKCKKSN